MPLEIFVALRDALITQLDDPVQLASMRRARARRSS
jgi:hypothetical protein